MEHQLGLGEHVSVSDRNPDTEATVRVVPPRAATCLEWASRLARAVGVRLDLAARCRPDAPGRSGGQRTGSPPRLRAIAAASIAAGLALLALLIVLVPVLPAIAVDDAPASPNAAGIALWSSSRSPSRRSPWRGPAARRSCSPMAA